MGVAASIGKKTARNCGLELEGQELQNTRYALKMTGQALPKSVIEAFAAPYAPPEEEAAARWLREPRVRDEDVRIDAMATRLVRAIRSKAGGLGGIEDFLHAYSLSTREGLALMVLAEALLRVPDADTANRLIEDK